jgi:hypothetical protein
LQTIFKERRDLLAALVEIGGYGPNIDRYYLQQDGPALERAKRRDVSLLLGLRF